MVVCKFFLQGTCKFGSMCKFDHEINDSYNPYQTTGTSILRHSNFGSAQLPQPKISQEKSSVDTGTLIKSVVSDMTQAEKGGQWLFSCYAPYKEKPAFPGFEDQSFEELRHGYYEAAKAGTVEQFKEQIQGMVQQVLMKVRTLQNPSPDIVNLLINIYNTPASQQAGIYSGYAPSTNSSNFSFKTGSISQQNTSIFAQANQNMFGNSQQQQSTIFNPPANNAFTGGNQNIFANQQTTNNFAPQIPTTGSSNVFAQANANKSVFAGQQAAVATNSGSFFNNNSQPPNSNIFTPQNQQVNLFQPVSQAPNIFGPPSNPTKTPLLPTPTIFSQSQIPQPQMNQMSQMPQINNQIPQTSIFSQAPNHPKNETPQSYSNSIFNSVPHPPILVPLSGNFDQSLYSKLDELTEDEIKWFQSDDLDISRIPEKPPTFEMCFKN